MRRQNHVRQVGTIALFASPWARGAMTDAEWDTLRSLDIEGTLSLLADSARGPFHLRLNVTGMPEIRAEGSTVAAAIAAAVELVAA